MRIPFKEWGAGRRVRRRTRPTGTIRVGITLLMCLCIFACGNTESTIVQRHKIGSKLLTVTDQIEPSAFGGSKRVIAVRDTLATRQVTAKVMECEQHFNVDLVEFVDTLLAVIALRYVTVPTHFSFIVFSLAPQVGQLDFPGWWIRDIHAAGWDRYTNEIQTIKNGDYIIEHCALKSDDEDHILVLRSMTDSLFAFNVYFVDADEMKISFKDSSTLRVDYGWIDSAERCEFEITLWQNVGEEIVLRAVGLSARSEE